jgi:hypothetical protein
MLPKTFLITLQNGSTTAFLDPSSALDITLGPRFYLTEKAGGSKTGASQRPRNTTAAEQHPRLKYDTGQALGVKGELKNVL